MSLTSQLTKRLQYTCPYSIGYMRLDQITYNVDSLPKSIKLPDQEIP